MPTGYTGSRRLGKARRRGQRADRRPKVGASRSSARRSGLRWCADPPVIAAGSALQPRLRARVDPLVVAAPAWGGRARRPEQPGHDRGRRRLPAIRAPSPAAQEQWRSTPGRWCKRSTASTCSGRRAPLLRASAPRGSAPRVRILWPVGGLMLFLLLIGCAYTVNTLAQVSPGGDGHEFHALVRTDYFGSPNHLRASEATLIRCVDEADPRRTRDRPSGATWRAPPRRPEPAAPPAAPACR